MSKPHIVIVGSGFGGVYTAKHLTKHVKRGTVDVTLVSTTNYFLFTPLLHEVATGNLSAFSVTESLREIFFKSGVNVLRDDVISLDTRSRTLTTKRTTLHYDALVLATGAVSNNYSIPGVAEHALPLKTLLDAVRIRAKIITTMEGALQMPRSPSFTVIGGGATGVEVAAELSELVRMIAMRYFPKTHQIPSVTLISSTPELLNQSFHPFLKKTAEARLRNKGIQLMLGTAVAKVEENRVELTDGSTVASDVTIWTAGVKPTLPEIVDENPSLSGSRVRVDETLRAIGDPRIFAIGDVAATPAPTPMLAQAAVAQAPIVAKNVIAALNDLPLKPFIYTSKGSLISLGEWYAAGEIMGVTIKGKFAWWLWRTVYLFKFLSIKKRIRIAFEWTVDLFTPRDTSNIL